MNATVRSCLLALLVALPDTALAADELVFTAPPRETGESEADVYQPLADFLSAITKKKVVYRAPSNWLTYQAEMRKGMYDIVFDGPHFISWRIQALQHEPLVKLPGKLAFVVVVKKDNERINTTKDVAGRLVCGLAPPNLATLTMYNQFGNPARQPLILEVKSFKAAYDNLVAGKCQAAVLRDAALANLDKDKQATRVVYKSEGVANQGFSAGPRLNAEEKTKITEALLAPEAKTKLVKFFDSYNKGKDLVKAGRQEYEGLTVYLKDQHGF